MQTRVTRSFVNAKLVYVIRELAKAMDRNVYIGPGIEGDVTVRLRAVPPQAALALILADAENEIAYKLVGANTSIVAPPEKSQFGCDLRARVETFDTPYLIWRAAQALTEPPEPIEKILVVKYSGLTEVASLLGSLLPDLKIDILQDHPGKLLLNGPPPLVEQAEEWIHEIDTFSDPLDQIILECKWADLSEAQVGSLGVQWSDSPWPATVRESIRFGETYSAADQAPRLLPSGLFRRNPGPFLIAQSNVRVLASPRMALRDAQEGTTHLGDKFPLISLDIRSAEFQEAFLDLGIRLNTKCTRLSNGAIRCHVQGEFTWLEELLAEHYPRSRTLSFAGEADLQDGQTLILTGLATRDELQAAAHNVPLLRDLPMQGSIFQADRGDRQLYLLFTPSGFH